MRIFLTLCLAICLCASAFAATPAELTAAQQRLTSYLEEQIKQGESDEKEFRAQLKAGTLPEMATLPENILKHISTQRAALKQLLTTAKQTPAVKLPNMLADMRLSCTQGNCKSIDQTTLEDALLAYGPLVFAPLQTAWIKQDEPMQEALVYLAGRFTPPECRLVWLDEVLKSPAHRVRYAALQVIRNTCAEGQIWPRLEAQLTREQNPALILAWLNLVPQNSTQSVEYRRRLISLAEEGRVPLDQALPAICTEPLPNLDMVQRPINAAFWLKAYRENPTRQMCLVEALFSQIKNPDTLGLLTPLLSDAASHLYSFTGTFDLAGNVITAPHLQVWESRPGLDVAMLSTFRNNLPPTTFNAWLNQPGMSLGDKIILAYWLSRDPAELLPAQLPFVLTVTTPEGQVVSTHEQPLTLNTPFDFTVPGQADFPAINYKGTLQFSSETLSYRLAGFLVGLQPAGAMFDARIPLLGQFTTDLNLQGKTYRWTLKINSEGKY